MRSNLSMAVACLLVAVMSSGCIEGERSPLANPEGLSLRLVSNTPWPVPLEGQHIHSFGLEAHDGPPTGDTSIPVVANVSGISGLDMDIYDVSWFIYNDTKVRYRHVTPVSKADSADLTVDMVGQWVVRAHISGKGHAVTSTDGGPNVWNLERVVSSKYSWNAVLEVPPGSDQPVMLPSIPASMAGARAEISWAVTPTHPGAGLEMGAPFAGCLDCSAETAQNGTVVWNLTADPVVDFGWQPAGTGTDTARLTFSAGQNVAISVLVEPIGPRYRAHD